MTVGEWIRDLTERLSLWLIRRRLWWLAGPWRFRRLYRLMAEIDRERRRRGLA